MKNYSLKKGEYPPKPENNENEYFGNGWSVLKKDNKYFFKYISGSLQGQFKVVEISKADFLLAKNQEINFDVLCNRYDVS